MNQMPQSPIAPGAPGLTSLMPGQAPQMGANPAAAGGAPQLAINPNINYNRAIELFKDLPDDAVQRALTDPQMAAIAASELSRRNRIRNSTKGQEALDAGKPPTVISQLLGAQPQAQPQAPPQPQPQEAPQQPPQGMDQGVAGMPAPNMQQGFAEGGVVAFEKGGDPAVERLLQGSEEGLQPAEGLEALPVAQKVAPTAPLSNDPMDKAGRMLPAAPKTSLKTPEEIIREAERYAQKEGAANDIYKPYLERTQKELKAAEGDSSDKNMKRSLMLAGLQMLASDKRGLAGIAEGGVKGLQQYELLQEKDLARKEKLRDAELKLVEAKDARRRGDMDRYAVLLKQYESNRLEADKLGNDYLKIKAALAGDIMTQESRDRATGVQAESNRLTATGQQMDRARQRMLDIQAKAVEYAKAVASTQMEPAKAQAVFEKAYSEKLKQLQSEVMVDSVAKPPANAKIRN